MAKEISKEEFEKKTLRNSLIINIIFFIVFFALVAYGIIWILSNS